MKKFLDLFGKKTIRELNEEVEKVPKFDAKLLEQLEFNDPNKPLKPASQAENIFGQSVLNFENSEISANSSEVVGKIDEIGKKTEEKILSENSMENVGILAKMAEITGENLSISEKNSLKNFEKNVKIQKNFENSKPAILEDGADFSTQIRFAKKPNISSEKIAKIKQNGRLLQTDRDYLGHRSRLRTQALKHGANTLKDYELLELLLTYSIPRMDTKPMAKKLLNQFGSLRKIMLSEVAKLARISGIGESTICFLHVVHELSCRMAMEEISDEVLLNSPDKVINYCKLRMAGLQYEQFRVLFLNRKNKLIFDEEIQSGTIDKAAVFPRELVRRAIEVGAGAIILVHNHPSGDPLPSKADIETTINIQKAANLMEIFLYDHIIIGKNQHYSMRSNNILG